jgi:galactitol-specific phosphotransferase system IIB component
MKIGIFKLLIKVLFAILILSSLIFGVKFNRSLSGIYEISYGVFGKLGEAKMRIDKLPNNKYKIQASAYATGFAKTISNGLKEEYTSLGYIKNKIFIPTSFTKIVTTNNGFKKYLYEFDYKNKNITKYFKGISIEKVLIEGDDGFSFYEEQKKIKTDKEWLKFFATEDILSMFFNVGMYIDNFNKDIIKRLSAVGASEDDGGRIDLIVPSKKLKNEIASEMENAGDILIVKIYKDIFTSESGEMALSLNENGVCNYILLRDVLFFGDIRGKLKNLKIN